MAEVHVQPEDLARGVFVIKMLREFQCGVGAAEEMWLALRNTPQIREGIQYAEDVFVYLGVSS